MRGGREKDAQIRSLTEVVRALQRELATLNEESSAARGTMLRLIRQLVDPDECWFDHHGGCQAHGYLSLEPGQRCPHAEAQELLKAIDRDRT